MAYSTKKQVLDMIITLRPDFTLEDINEMWLDYASYKVDAILEDYGVDTPCTDVRNILLYASILFYFESAGKTGQIQSQFGDVKERKKGQVETKYQTSAPMFFFSSGEAKQFYGLLGHETWRMEAYHFCKAYIKAEFRRRSGKKFMYASYRQDATLRGHNWDKEKWVNASGQNYNEFNTRKVG